MHANRPTFRVAPVSLAPLSAASFALIATLGLVPAAAFAQNAEEGQPAAAQTEQTEPESAVEQLTDEQRARLCAEKFDLDKNGLAIKGYDPVSYFPEGGSEPKKGDKKIELVRHGVHYRFGSEKNRDLFKANPDKYAPAYGGWCAYAMAKGDYTKPDPKRFLIQNGRLMLFYDGFFGDTYEKWNDEVPKLLEPLADEFWEGETEKEAERIKAEKDG